MIVVQERIYRMGHDQLTDLARELDGFDRWNFYSNMRQLDATLEFDMSDGKPRGTPRSITNLLGQLIEAGTIPRGVWLIESPKSRKPHSPRD